MNKFCANLVCCLIPNKKKRDVVRSVLIGKKNLIKPQNNNKLIETIRQELHINLCKNAYITQRLITAAKTNHNAFNKFKGAFRGKIVVLIGAGPTVNYFEPIENAIYVGCNRAFLFDRVNFDYLFSIDKVGIDQFYEDFFNYRVDNCIKFIGDQNLGINFQIPENLISLKNTYRYITDIGLNEYLGQYPLDISLSPLINSSTVSIQAMQFILWGQPEKIYIVGIDCTNRKKEHFIGNSIDCSIRNEDMNLNDQYAIDSYKNLKTFAQTYYPNTEIISVNPVGLKGIFKDVYTKTYQEQNIL